MALLPNQVRIVGCPCCCKCEHCAGVGYWDQYTVVVTGYSGFAINADGTYIVNYVPGGFFSGIHCTWVGTRVSPSPTYGVTMAYDPTALLGCPAPAGISSLGGGLFACGTFDCLGVMTFSIPGFPGSTMVFTPSGTWHSCGENSDGTSVYAAEGMRPMMADRPTVRTSLPILHPDRCESFMGRTELKAGCNGWTCKGACQLSLPAVPGAYCQTCTKYVPDPDFAGQGVKGWLT